VGGTGTIGSYDSGEFQVPRVGVPACTQAAGCVADILNWGAADVRKQTTLVFASSRASITPGALNATTVLANSTDLVLPGVSVTVADIAHPLNSMPTGSKVDITAIDNSQYAPAIKDPIAVPAAYTYGTCTLNSPASFTVTNSLDPLQLNVSLKNCVVGDQIQVTVTSPLGVVTSIPFAITP
jgi:hypothetical protein